MSNEFYHGFKIGFNYWYLMAPLLMLLSFIIGTTKYRLGKSTGKIYVMRGEFVIIVTSLISDATLMIVFAKESFFGMVQVVLNHLSKTEIAWAPFMVVGCFLAVVLAFFCLFYGCGKLGEVTIHKFLVFLIKLEKNEDEDVQDIILNDIEEILKSDKIIYFEPRRSPRT